MNMKLKICFVFKKRRLKCSTVIIFPIISYAENYWSILK